MHKTRKMNQDSADFLCIFDERGLKPRDYILDQRSPLDHVLPNVVAGFSPRSSSLDEGYITCLQKFSRALMTKRRLPVAVVIRPKLGELMLRFAAIGGVNCGVFSTLTESTRISNSLLSVILTRLIRFTSNPSSGGPSIHPSPRVPTCPG